MQDSAPHIIALEDRASDGARLSSPSAARNRSVIAQLLAERLSEGARVLEIASGTGEHAVAATGLRPDLSWTPSDIDEASLASQADWARDAQGRIEPPLKLDVSQADWWGEAPAIDAVFCANMIHIAPWRAAQGLFAGAGRLLSDAGLLLLYGPFLEGEATAPSNLEFDASLKSRNPDWGVRALDDVVSLSRTHGFRLAERVETPANNRLLRFQRGGA
ncbi:MAG: DUF938 domain-containing protein [Pseudomonadota bacterium]